MASFKFQFDVVIRDSTGLHQRTTATNDAAKKAYDSHQHQEVCVAIDSVYGISEVRATVRSVYSTLCPLHSILIMHVQFTVPLIGRINLGLPVFQEA